MKNSSVIEATAGPYHAVPVWRRATPCGAKKTSALGYAMPCRVVPDLVWNNL